MKRLLLLKSLFLLCALIVGTNAWADNFELVTSSSQIVDNGEYLIVSVEYNSKYYALGIVNGSFRDHVEVTVDEGVVSASVATLTSDTKPYVITLKKSGSNWNLYDAVNEKYLNAGYRASSKNKNNLSTDASVGTTTTGNNGVFTISVSAQGVATITNENSFQVQANPSSSRIASYRNGGQTDVCLYKKVVDDNAVTTATTINADGITNTNKFFGTNAGTLTASVTYGSPATAVPGATVTWSSANTSVATVDASTGVVTLVGAGSTTITASYAGVANEYKSSSADYVLNVTDEDPNMVTLWSEDFSGFDADDVPSGGTYGYVCVNGNSDTKIYEANMAGGTSPELLVNKNGGSFTATIPLENITGNLKLRFKSNAYAVTVSTSTGGISISGDASFNAAGEHTVTFTGVTTSMTSVEIKFAAASSNVRIDDIVLKGSKVVPVTISSISGFATLYTPYAIDFSSLSSELKAYTASVAGSTVTLTEVDDIPANTGVVLKGDVKTHNIPVINSSSTAQGDLTGNTSAATAYNAFSGYDLYMLALNGAGKAQFTLVNEGSIAAGKAFLKLAHADARELNVVFADDEATGVADVRCKMADGRNDFYNLNGQKVLNPTKGLYIVNGKKYVIK